MRRAGVAQTSGFEVCGSYGAKLKNLNDGGGGGGARIQARTADLKTGGLRDACLEGPNDVGRWASAAGPLLVGCGSAALRYTVG